MNNQDEAGALRQRARTPRAAAVAGIVFSVLQIATLVLVRSSIPDNPLGPVAEVISHSKTVSFALNLQPFAGIAFLWFLAVLRDRLGELEDRFFATVFLGSGLLYIAMMLVASGLAGGLLGILAGDAGELVRSGGYGLGRLEIAHVHIYAAKMAAVFMMSTCTISLQTRIVPRWMVFLGYLLALILLLGAQWSPWSTVAFPLWVLVISVHILLHNLRGQPSIAGNDASRGY